MSILVKDNLVTIPADEQFSSIGRRFGQDGMLAYLTIQNCLMLSTSDYRNELLAMYAVQEGAVFLVPTGRPHYNVISTIRNHHRVNLPPIEVGLLCSMMAYQELSQVAPHFVRDFHMLRRCAVEQEKGCDILKALN